MNPALELTDIHKAFGGLVVSRGVNLTLRAGEIHALIGPNGAGKTTLIDQIAGELKPDAGRIRLFGRDVTHLPVTARARLGLVRSYQVVRLMDDLTVRENLLLAMTGRARLQRLLAPAFGRREAEDAAVRALLADFSLIEARETPAGALPHGLRRMLELALALAARPRVLLLDEPLAGLGAEQRRRVADRIARVRGTVTVLLVEHDMDAVFRLAERISVLDRGTVIATGTPDEIRTDGEVRAAYLGR